MIAPLVPPHQVTMSRSGWPASSGDTREAARYACILSLVITDNAEAEYFKQQLSIHKELVHITVEVSNHRGSANLPADHALA